MTDVWIGPVRLTAEQYHLLVVVVSAGTGWMGGKALVYDWMPALARLVRWAQRRLRAVPDQEAS